MAHNKRAYLEDLVEDNRDKSNGGYEVARKKTWEALHEEYPINLAVVGSVSYHEKADLYTVTSPAGILKTTNAVAQFLLENAKLGQGYGAKPTVHARMVDGVVDAVLVLFSVKE